jgi:hypothetical protein
VSWFNLDPAPGFNYLKFLNKRFLIPVFMIKLLFTVIIKVVQATEASNSNPQKRISGSSKHEISSLVSIFCESLLPSWILILIGKIRIQPTKIIADSDPQHCIEQSLSHRYFMLLWQLCRSGALWGGMYQRSENFSFQNQPF